MKLKIIPSLLVSWLLVILIVVGYGFGVHVTFGKWPKSGVFGDSFGALNTLFAGMALEGLGIAIWFQNQTPSLQQQEIANQNSRLSAQEKEAKI